MKLIPDDIWGILTVWQEARGEPYIGKVAVAEVIQRRAKLKYSSDGTIAGTVLKPYQFSGWNTNDPNRILAAKADRLDPLIIECIKAWEEAKGGTNFTNEAVLYCNLKVCSPAWANKSIVVAEIGNHTFYVPKG